MPRTAIAQSQNLLIRSDEYDNAGAWSLATYPCTVTANTDLAPDGTLTADTITASATGANIHGPFQQVLGLPSPRVQTLSVFVKQGTQQWVWLGDERHSSFIDAWFDLTNGVVGTTTGVIRARIEPASRYYNSPPAGWWRISITAIVDPSNQQNPLLATATLQPTTGNGVRIWAPAGTETVIAWRAQIVVADWPGLPTQTLGAAVAGPIRNNPATQQNLFLQSEDYVNASWAKGDLSAITGQGLQPYSTTLFTANSLTPNVNNAPHYMQQGIASGLIVGGVFSTSIYAKWQQNEEWIAIAPNGGAQAVWFNVRTGTIGTTAGTVLGKQITATPDGWYRCEVWLPMTSTTTTFYLATADALLNYVGSNTPAQLWWGASCAAANWTGPYQQTVAAVVNTGPIRGLRSHA